MQVRLSTYSAAVGEFVTVELLDYERASETTSFSINVQEVGLADFNSIMTTGLPVIFCDEKLEATLNFNDFFKPGAIYEISMLNPSGQEDTFETLTGGRDFPRTFFKVKITADEPPAIAEEAKEAAHRIEDEREANYARPLGDPSRLGNTLFRVIMFVERVMLTRQLRVPGVELIPLREGDNPYGNRSTDEAHIINKVFSELGWQAWLLNPSDWAEHVARERPILLLHFPKVFATTHEQAAVLARNRRDRLLDLLTLHRGSYGVPFAVAVQKLGTGKPQHEETRVWSEAQRFGGNIMGGFASGEDPGLLLKHDQAMTASPFVALCLILYREASTETDLDVAYFRYWNLLEVIASNKIVSSTHVTDFEGQQLREGGKKATTDRARGRVYELLKRYMQERNCVERHFGRPLSEGLWDAVGVWYACRNATAHYGKFFAEDPEQKKKWWYTMALKAYSADSVQGGLDTYFSNLAGAGRTMVQLVLDAETHE